jgi:2-polyprenyl-6-methoxyphenol hydroxylase-like FAD-dependent oxidoreductase
MAQTDVLIIGAGPTGLVLALCLTKLGIRIRIVDQASAPGTTSRALAIQARTFELYRQLDLTDDVLAQGYAVPGINLWVGGKRKAHVSFASFAGDITPYGPFIFPQDQHERLLIARLEQLGVSVERDTEFVSYRQQADGVTAELRTKSGSFETCEARYLAGCDGASSPVRHAMGSGFPGGTYQHLFYVADVVAHGPAMNGELNVDLDEADFLAIFPMQGEARARLVGTVRGEREHSDTLAFSDVSDRAMRNMKLTVDKVNWFSTYHVHHRVTDRFRDGRVFLLGDAAHIHSPAGGQGMNTGIGDAINLGWKLHAVIAGRAPSNLLESYELERKPFAQRLVATTDRGFTMATAQGPFAAFIRTRIVPLVVPALFRFSVVRQYLFRAVSQTTIEYRNSPLSRGNAGGVSGGDRLPWAPAPGADNFDSLNEPRWQVHVYGTARDDLSAWCAKRGMALQNYAWHERHGAAGFAKDALYLIRPDAYVALADPGQALSNLEGYLETMGFRFSGGNNGR